MGTIIRVLFLTVTVTVTVTGTVTVTVTVTVAGALSNWPSLPPLNLKRGALYRAATS